MYEKIIKVELTSHTLYKGFENQLLIDYLVYMEA
jgi:hypothetical protein